MELVIPFRENFLPWLEQVAHVPRSAITIIQESPDRLYFEDPANRVLEAFLVANSRPIISQPSNHGSWVSLSVRWEAAPSCQLVVCRRLVADSTDRYEAFYGVDFDHAPWTTKRLDWMARHTLEVVTNALLKQTTDQGKIRFGLMQAGVTFDLGLDQVTLERDLLNKGLLTKDDIAHARKQVEQEAAETLAEAGRAMRKGPAGGIQ